MTVTGDDRSMGGEEGRQRPLLAALGGVTIVLDWSGRLIAAACLGFMFVLLLINVVLRYVFGSGIAWAYEIHALLLPWLVAGGIVIAMARHRHIAITLLPSLLGDRGQRALLLCIQCAIVVICISVLWSSQPILKASQFQKLSTLGIKQVWGYASLVYAFAGMAIIAMVNIVSVVAGNQGAEPSSRYTSLS